MASPARRAGRAVIALAFAFVVVLVSALVFLIYPTSLEQLLGVVLVVLVGLGAVQIGRSVADSALPSHNVAEVAVEGPITRDGGGSITSPPVGATADEVVDQIELADEDRGARALLLKINTPGGEIVPSEDIRIAAEQFDGPVVGYATDLCASGGYDIASACDEIWAREGTLVGSVGVIGSRVTAAGLADKLGLEYEGLTAGEYKDAGTPLKEMDPDERAYLQGLIDDYYDQFVDVVSEGRELDEQAVRDTEARVYLGSEAVDIGLVDEIGTRDAVEDRLQDLVGEPVEVRAFEPAPGIVRRLRVGSQSVAYALGAGIADALRGEDGGLRFRW